MNRRTLFRSALGLLGAALVPWRKKPDDSWRPVVTRISPRTYQGIPIGYVRNMAADRDRLLYGQWGGERGWRWADSTEMDDPEAHP